MMCSQGIYASVGVLRAKKLVKRAVMTLRDSLYFIQASKSQPRKKGKKRPKMRYQQRKNLLPSKIWVLFSLDISVISCSYDFDIAAFGPFVQQLISRNLRGVLCLLSSRIGSRICHKTILLIRTLQRALH